MKKIVGQIGIAALIMCVICAVFWKIQWLTSMEEIAVMFKIFAAVVLCDLVMARVKEKLSKRG